MIVAVAATILPLGFLVVLLGGGALFLRNNIEQDGEAGYIPDYFRTTCVVIWIST